MRRRLKARRLGNRIRCERVVMSWGTPPQAPPGGLTRDEACLHALVVVRTLMLSTVSWLQNVQRCTVTPARLLRQHFNAIERRVHRPVTKASFQEAIEQ